MKGLGSHFVGGHAGSPVRRSLDFIFGAWFFGAIFAFITTGAVITRYARALGLPDYGFGLIAAIPFGTALMQLPTSYLVGRFGHHKSAFIVAGAIHRALWIAVALIPWVVPRSWGCYGLIVLMTFSALVGHVAGPIWFAWMAEVVPSTLRGRYFSRRSQLGQLVGIGVTLLTGWWLDRAAAAGPETAMRTMSLMLGIGGLIGVGDFLCFIPVPGPREKVRSDLTLLGMLAEPLRDPHFRRFLGFTGMLTFATAFIGPYMWLYLFDEVRMTNTQANIFLVVIPMIGAMISLPLWGRLIDKFGRKPIMVITMFFIVNGATAWLFVRPDNWWPGYLVVVISILTWPGMELANFNFLLALNESDGKRHGMAFSAMHSLTVAACGMLSGLFGSKVAHLLDGWHGVVLGVPLSYHAVLFILSGVLRLMAGLFLIGFKDEGAVPTRVAARYMWTEAIWNVQQVVSVPGRSLTLAGSWVRRFNPLGKRK